MSVDFSLALCLFVVYNMFVLITFLKGYKMKTWVYVEDHNGYLIAKLYEKSGIVFNAFKTLGFTIATKQKSELSVVYRIYK